MKEKEITKVLDALIEKEITYDEAKDKLFVLYGVSKSFKCCKETDKCIIAQCDDCKMVYNF